MKNKFIRILSPITLIVVAVLDAAVIGFGVFAYQKTKVVPDSWTIAFFVIEVIAIILAILVSKEVVSHGIKFYDDKMEFTGLDNDNEFEYASIEKIETSKDTKASLKKNFIDRYSQVIIYKKDESVVTINLGLTTVKTLKKIEEEIKERIG